MKSGEVWSVWLISAVLSAHLEKTTNTPSDKRGPVALIMKHQQPVSIRGLLHTYLGVFDLILGLELLENSFQSEDFRKLCFAACM